MNEITLVNPMDKSELRSLLGLKAPPLNLMYLAAILREAGYSVKIVDDNILCLGPTGLGKLITKGNPSLIGLTAATSTIESALSYVAAIKSHVPDTMTVIGGPHPTFLPVETLNSCKSLDVVVMGEGEETLRELADCLDMRQDDGLSDVRGIAYRRKGVVRVNPPRPPIRDLDRLPLPARDLVDFQAYRDPVNRKPIGAMITSRGCVYGCSYCVSSRVMGSRFRGRSPESVVDEMEELASKFGVEDIEFIDDNFMLDKKRARAIAEEIRSRGIDVRFAASSRIDCVTRRLLEELKSAGLATMYYGVESGCQRVLDLMNKGITLEQIDDAVKTTKEKGIKVFGSFILGYPGETLEEMDRTIDYSLRLGVDFAQYSILTPYPGTPIHNELLEKGLLGNKSYKKYTVLEPVIAYERLGISSKEVGMKLVKAYVRFYFRPNYLLKHTFVFKIIARALFETLAKRKITSSPDATLSRAS